MKRGGGDRVSARIADLCRDYSLPPGSGEALISVLGSLESEHSPTAVKVPSEGVDVHVADSLSGLNAPELASTTGLIADIGSGCGIPAIPLAVALPAARVIAVEAIGRKCEFIERASLAAGVMNVQVVKARAEEWGEGRSACDFVTARALAPLPVLAEYAAPLLRIGGSLIAWKGTPDPAEVDDAAAACEVLGMDLLDPIEVNPWPAGGRRSLIRMRKAIDTPDRFPRRPGMAVKRPLGL